MKRSMVVLGVAGIVCAVAHSAFAEGASIFHASTRLRVEYDDNIFQTTRNEQDSFKFIAELSLSLNFTQPTTFLGLHYRPSFTYWEDRPGDSSDLNHQVDVVLNHEFTPRFSLSVRDRFRYAEIPEGIANDVIIREENSFIYNSLNATISSRLTPETRLDIGGRNIILQYDKSDVGNRQDYTRNVVGASVNHQLQPTLTMVVDGRFEDISYDKAKIRDSQSTFIGVGADQSFSPNLLGSIRLGYQNKDFDSAQRSSVDSPYVDANLTALPSPATRLTLGAAFSQSETDVYPFANQERTRIYATAAHDITAQISAYLSASFARGDYKADQAAAANEAEDAVVVVPPVFDGSEDSWQLSARATYKLDRNNILEVGYQFTDLSSDFAGRDFTRNRLNIGYSFLF